MNNEREELARLANGGLRNGVTADDFRRQQLGNNSIGEYIADAILAAGYRKPRVITTVEELDALPDEALVRSAFGVIHQKQIGFGEGHVVWVCPGDADEHTAGKITLPASVLYAPDVTA